MAWWQRLFGGISSYDPAQRVLPGVYEPYMGVGSIPVADPGVPLSPWLARESVEHFWKTQPNVRKVVDFIARNVASVPFHVFRREDDDSRTRVRDGELAELLAAPQAGKGGFRFWHSVVSDFLLYDVWAAVVRPVETGGYELVQVPSWRLWFETDPLRQVVDLWYWQGDKAVPESQQWKLLDRTSTIFDYGYAPNRAGLSPIRTLRDVLDESAEAVSYRRAVWANGPRVPGYITRPADQQWTTEQRGRFVAQMKSTYGKDGPGAGGLPLLEDGMKIEDRKIFTPQDAMDLEGRRLTAIEVAAAFHIAPELVGAQQGNYSNVREYRQMLYRDSLGPTITSLEDVVNGQLRLALGLTGEEYAEVNIDAKLRGSFEEEANSFAKAVGGPWMTRNEARARKNMPAVDGGDDLITPLNLGNPGTGMSADEITKRVGAAGILIRSGFEPEAALTAVGLDPVAHLGLLPVTVRPEE